MRFKKASILVSIAALFTFSCKEDNLLPPVNTNAYISFINAAPFLGNDSKGTSVRAIVETNGHKAVPELSFYYSYIYPEPNKYLPFTEGNCKVIFKDSVHTLLW